VFEKGEASGKINPVNEKFDPHRHQAMTMVPHPGEPNQVVNVNAEGLSAARTRHPPGSGDGFKGERDA